MIYSKAPASGGSRCLVGCSTQMFKVLFFFFGEVLGLLLQCFYLLVLKFFYYLGFV